MDPQVVRSRFVGAMVQKMLEHLARLRPETGPQEPFILLDIESETRDLGLGRDRVGSAKTGFLFAHVSPAVVCPLCRHPSPDSERHSLNKEQFS